MAVVGGYGRRVVGMGAGLRGGGAGYVSDDCVLGRECAIVGGAPLG